MARCCCPLPVTLHHGVLGSAKRPAGLDRLLCHATGVTQRREWLPFPMFPCASRVSARRGGGVGSRGHRPTPSVASKPDPVPAGTRSWDIPSATNLGDRVLLCAAFYRFHAVLGEMVRSRGCNWPKVRDSVLSFLFCFLSSTTSGSFFSGEIIAELDVWFKKENRVQENRVPAAEGPFYKTEHTTPVQCQHCVVPSLSNC